MLLDPFEEQLHLPALPVDVGNRPRRKRKVVGQKLQALAPLRVEVAHLSQRIWISCGGFDGGKNHGLIRKHARALIPPDASTVVRVTRSTWCAQRRRPS